MLDRFIRLVALPGLLLSYIVGVVKLTDYASRPATTTYEISREAINEVVARHCSPGNRKCILFFYQPGCPCTVAAARNLQRISPLLDPHPDILAFAYQPDNAPSNWLKKRSTETLNRITSTKVIIDTNGKIAGSLGVKTSGHCIVYSKARGVIFSGGLTPLRGHEGTGPSLTQFTHCINDQDEPFTEWPVFGCSIADNAQAD
ncbi:hypothetical protein LOC67_14170 [Stieleria sp. JC731]|uniref:hypothetical protein n=1 Tax=Pirellulaceae TaxID=2691357 RepID=UPI001E5F2583|nr:hypothetical protein [Stieleria sp. JC731]MCC9601701.1 hypothetical protein [Stieleria sp. JC731]